ncbi:MAG: hypothetical protein CEE41_01725 [Hadesarchaea archaeon B3_Hades]|nr:MAG: hypothetical protein CEE41_01725 [Hadesarchaea archaeon B3_Hades]
MHDEKKMAMRLARILRAVAKEIEDNPDFLKNIELRIEDIPIVSGKKDMLEPIDIDIFRIFSEGGDQALRQRLEPLELRALVQIVRQHGFDPSKLAEKWKDKERLINLILERVAARSDSGKVFKDYP